MSEEMKLDINDVPLIDKHEGKYYNPTNEKYKKEKETTVISFRINKGVYERNKKKIRDKVSKFIESNNFDQKIEFLETELNRLKLDNSDDLSIYEWVKRLPIKRRALLNRKIVSDKIKAELFEESDA